MAEIKCPQCQGKMKVFLIESQYQGPLKCTYCKGLFQVTIVDGELNSAKPMTEADLEKIQAEEERAREIEALRAKFRKAP